MSLNVGRNEVCQFVVMVHFENGHKENILSKDWSVYRGKTCLPIPAIVEIETLM